MGLCIPTHLLMAVPQQGVSGPVLRHSWFQTCTLWVQNLGPIFFNLSFIYLLMAVLGLRCSTRAFSSCGTQASWWLLLPQSTGSRACGLQ